MELFPKDVLKQCVCNFLSLRDIYRLALTSKYFLSITYPLLSRIREMFAKWHPKRCFLEAKREKNIKIMRHFDQVEYVHEDECMENFIKVCKENDISDLENAILDTVWYDKDGVLDTVWYDECIGNNIVYGMETSLIYGSWACFDKMAASYPETYKQFITRYRVIMKGDDVTLTKKDLNSFVGECCKRKLYKMRNFLEFVAMKCIEVDNYELFASLKIEMHGQIEWFKNILIFCDDPRFSSLFCDLRNVMCGPHIFGNRKLRTAYLEYVGFNPEEESESTYSE